ncbi:MAG TPA: sigma-70 family RNA polymerase sigma factor [Anaerolineales bacterium]|nr:sigma-70 family RNA polymerase sigma factor [Anaerolineales bacterium]
MQPDTDDLHAIRRLKRGDIGGLEILIARYQGKALRAAFLVTHDNAMAEDVVQESFVRFFHRAHYFDERHAFEPYFMRSVVNAALNAIQREKRTRPCDFSEANTSALETLLEQAASVEQQAEFNSLKQQIFEALSQLPPRQRAVIVQRYYLEMTEKEMSEALEAPPGTVKWLLNAARARLRSLLGRERMAE